ncbi:hypothetical protein Efla_002484 [Eimeria flavescens]
MHAARDSFGPVSGGAWGAPGRQAELAADTSSKRQDTAAEAAAARGAPAGATADEGPALLLHVLTPVGSFCVCSSSGSSSVSVREQQTFCIAWLLAVAAAA